MEEKLNEKEDFKKLLKYVETEVMKYDENTKLTKYMVLRLRGFSQGKYMANNKIPNCAKYNFKIMLLAFKLCKNQISKYISKNAGNFNNEQHKFNGIMVILDNNINDVVIMLKNAKNSDKKINNLKLSHQTNKPAEYKKKGNIIENKNIDDLW